jgi:hypothetical protein
MTATTITQTFPYYCSSPLKKTDHLLSFEVSFLNDSKRMVFLVPITELFGSSVIWCCLLVQDYLKRNSIPVFSLKPEKLA